jgi:AcrR family transcriptional regulator
MEAATALERSLARELPSDKAIRIVEAMRASVAQRGIAGSTFDHVAREAGVSRGLLHYYFGTKERLLVEVVRRECDVRGELLDQAVAGRRRSRRGDRCPGAQLRGDPGGGDQRDGHLLRAADARPAQRRDSPRARRTGPYPPSPPLRTGSEAGVFELRADPSDVASFLFALADGVTIRRLSEPGLDVRPLIDQAVAAARALLA